MYCCCCCCCCCHLHNFCLCCCCCCCLKYFLFVLLLFFLLSKRHVFCVLFSPATQARCRPCLLSSLVGGIKLDFLQNALLCLFAFQSFTYPFTLMRSDVLLRQCCLRWYIVLRIDIPSLLSCSVFFTTVRHWGLLLNYVLLMNWQSCLGLCSGFFFSFIFIVSTWFFFSFVLNFVLLVLLFFRFVFCPLGSSFLSFLFCLLHFFLSAP